MKTIFKTLLITLVFIGSANFALADSSNDGIVAVVNDGVITSTQFDQGLAKARQRFAGVPASQRPTPAMLKQMVIQQMINQRLQLQLAKRSGMTVSDAQLDQAIGRIAKDNHKSVAELYATVKKSGFDKDTFRSEIRKQMTMQIVQHAAVASRVNISPDEVNDYLHIMSQSKNTNAEYNLLDLLVSLPDEPTSTQVAAAEKVANDIVTQLNNGVPMKTVFEKHQTGPNSIQEINMGWKKAAELPLPFVSTVETMKVGEVSKPLRAPNGFHILKLMQEKNSGVKGTAAQKRKQVEQMIYQRKYQDALMNWIAQLRSQAYVKINK